jgi:hypothetical protein
MQADRKQPGRMSMRGWAALAAVVAVGIWFAQLGEEQPAAKGLVLQHPPVEASRSALPQAATAAPAATLPRPPDAVVRHVREAYPLLTDVDFRCDAQGCGVTATIPPPTDAAFLEKRQEMLLGGLARRIEADGYRTIGPVQMEEVDDNLFHIRASVTLAQPR